MKDLFPRTVIDNRLSVSRMIIGTNWMAGYSHKSASADNMIKSMHSSPDSMVPMMEAFVTRGVDTIMAPFGLTPVIYQAVKNAEQKLGKEMIMVDTPVINVDDNENARKEALQTIKESHQRGTKICLIHHYSAEQLVNKNKRTMDRLDDYTKMIRDEGMIPGLSAHMPELVIYSDENGYDVQTYIQIYNCLGFLMQVEVEAISNIIHGAKKPVMTIKPMAAGRCTPFVGLNFSWATIRDCDMVTIGCFDENEAIEDIEISLAALERRTPNLEKRSSPAKKQAAFGDSAE